MKTLVSLLTATLLLAAFAPPAEARDPVSLDFFYDNLEPYGSWREVGDYGYCWQPRDVNQDWRPYSDGRWVYSDAGWTWDSDEPYGWAVYHYGRWADVDQIGWVWIPGTEWGPGWVSWRHSPRYVGWAPLPPEALFLRAVGLSGWVDDYYDIGPRSYRFVESRNFGSHRLNSVFIDQRQNLTIIHETTNITNITYEGEFVHNGGPRYDQQSRLSAEPIRRYKLDRRQDFDGDPRQQSSEHLRSRINGDSLSMMALPFDGRSSSAPHKLTEKLSRVEVNHGWKNAGSPAEIDEARAHMKSKVRAPDELPPRAKFDKPRQGEAQRPGDRPPGPKEDTTNPRMNRDDKSRRPDGTPSPPMRKDPVERPSQSKDSPPKPNMNRDEKTRRPDAPPTSPMKKQDPADRPSPPKDNPSKPGVNREDKPRQPEAPNSPPTRRPDPVERPSAPKFEPNREKPRQPTDLPKPQQERKPKMEPQKQQPEQRSEKKRPDPKPEASKSNPQMKRPESQPQQEKPKGKGKPDEKDKDKDKNKKNGVGLN